jgi:hypothetical protein
MLEPQFAATSRMVCKSTHLVPLNTQREALSRPPGCRSACSKWWCSCRGLVGKTWIDSRETRQTPAPCSMSNCTAPGPGVQSRRFASGSNLPDGIFSGRSATVDGAALSVENGRRSDGCRPSTQTLVGCRVDFHRVRSVGTARNCSPSPPQDATEIADTLH